MSTITFDTLKFVDRLEKAGATRELASALAEAQKEVFSEVLDSTLATKADVQSVKTDVQAVKTDLAALRADMQARIESMELRLTIKLGTFLAVAVGVILAVLKH